MWPWGLMKFHLSSKIRPMDCNKNYLFCSPLAPCFLFWCFSSLALDLWDPCLHEDLGDQDDPSPQVPLSFLVLLDALWRQMDTYEDDFASFCFHAFLTYTFTFCHRTSIHVLVLCDKRRQKHKKKERRKLKKLNENMKKDNHISDKTQFTRKNRTKELLRN